METALQLMRSKRVRRLPVVDKSCRLQGMLSISDFIRYPGWQSLLNETLEGICQRSFAIEGDTTRVSKAA